MSIHKNAPATSKGRVHLAREIDRIGPKLAAAAGSLGYERIAERPFRSAVARACKRAGLAKLSALQNTVPVRR